MILRGPPRREVEPLPAFVCLSPVHAITGTGAVISALLHLAVSVCVRGDGEGKRSREWPKAAPALTRKGAPGKHCLV
jgi:hypothetical protein